MRVPTALAFGLAAGSGIIPTAYGWGAAGHEIVATIAQIHLHPSVLPTICNILDLPLSKCHLAPISTWADRERMRMRWSAALHYIGAVGDHPAGHCAFPGTEGWAGSKGGNVLDGVTNVTGILADWAGKGESLEKRRIRGEPGPREEEALKFLVHFLGDMHQPLHLTGRDRGGNSNKVLFDGRHTNLHSAWDSSIIAKFVRTVPRNYSQPLPYPQIEASLRGTIYDSYIRRIMWEGVLSKWDDELKSWFDCPGPVPASAEEFEMEQGEDESTWQRILKTVSRRKEKIEITPDGPIVCPYAWSKPTHALNCEIVWPKELGFTRLGYAGPLVELDKPAYTGVIAQNMIVEKLLAQGGIRLAGILNWLFAEDTDGLTVPTFRA